MLEESTIMEGFRYRVPEQNEKGFPVMHGDKDITTEFPIIPTGMLSIWREDYAQDEDLFH